MIGPDEMLARWEARRQAARNALTAEIDRQIENTFTGRSARAEVRLESGAEAGLLASGYAAAGWRVKLTEISCGGMIRAVLEFTVEEKTEEKS